MATSGSTGTSAAGRCASSPVRSTGRSRTERARSSSTTRISRGRAGATSWRQPVGTASPHAASGSTRRSRRRRSTSSSGCSSASTRCPTPEELKAASRVGCRRCSHRRSRCARSASSSRRPRTKASRRSSTSPSRATPGTGTAGVFVAAAAVGALPLADVDHGVPHLVFDWRPGGGEAELAAHRRRCRPHRVRAARGRDLPAPRRPADLLVPPAAPRPPARLRATPRSRSGAVARGRRERRAPHARERPRRALRRGVVAQLPSGQPPRCSTIG